MKKIITLILTLSLATSLIACQNSVQNDDFNSDPIKSVGAVHVDSVDDFKDMGIVLSTPKNATDISYGTIDGKIALINFTLDGFNFNLRASKSKKDVELHGITDEFDDNEISQESDGENWSSSINVSTIKYTTCLATCNIFMVDKDDIHLSLDTSSDYSKEDMLSLMSIISSDYVELQV